jgi:uncharacterized membrane protein YbhN (UPF0104 family)
MEEAPQIETKAPHVWHSHEDEMPRMAITRERAILFAVFVLSCVAFLYFVLPNIAGFGKTVHRIEGGDRWWLAIGVVFELLSFAGYVVLFRAVFVTDDGTIGWRESYLITMAGLAATRLFAVAGAGGVAVTAWALRRSGMRPREVATRMLTFMVLLYIVYAGSLVIAGVGLGTGLLPGGGSFAITFVPAIVGAALVLGAAVVALLPKDLERRLVHRTSGSGRLARLLARLAAAPALAAAGIRTAVECARTRRAGLVGAPAWWGFDICVLWAAFHAFGSAPDFSVIWMAYFVGMFANLLPLPGGVGGVEGGMIGAFAAFGVELKLAVLAVLAYRAISFWLPTVPGAIAYFQLRRTVGRWQGQRRQADQGYTIQSIVS